MPRYYVCDQLTLGRDTPCIFDQYSMRNIWKRSGGDIGRCIRHGQLICNEMEAPSKKELHKRLKDRALTL